MTPLLAQRPRTDRAFERLYQKHVHAVYRYTLAVLHNEADAEDVTQTTFLSAYRAFQRGERPERPHNWLIKIAHNACRQRFRDSSRRPQEVEFDETLTPAAPAPDDDVPSATEIRRALGFLGFNQRAALVMRELEGRSYAEIAQILDVSVGAVETLIFRARRALREQLEGGLTCAEAELTLSRLQEQKLSSAERGSLRAHLRECKDCAVLERRNRAQRAAIKGLAVIPLPPSLGSFFGAGAVGGGAAVAGGGIGTKIVAVLAGAAIGAGLGHEAVKADAAKDAKTAAAKSATATRDSSASRQGRALTRKQRAAKAAARKARAKSSRAAGAGHTSKANQHAGAAAGAAGSSGSTGASSTQQSNTVNGTVQRTVQPLLPRIPPAPIELPELPPVQLPIQIPPLPLPPPPPLPPLPPPIPPLLPPPPPLP